jgi:hypothetical protein
MTEPNDKDPEQSAEAAPAAEGSSGARSSGRVAFDPRGNPIWEWQLETGVYSRDVSTQKLKKLDLGDLSIAESAIQKRPPGLGGSSTKGSSPAPGGGFNPYDNSSPPRPVSAKPKPAVPAPRKPAARPPTPPPRKESVLSRLDQWFKGKRGSKDEADYE